MTERIDIEAMSAYALDHGPVKVGARAVGQRRGELGEQLGNFRHRLA